MKKDLSYHTREYCVGITTHIAKEIRDSVDNKKAELLNVADAVSGVVGNNEKNGLNRFFRREIDQQDFDAILMVNEQGACISGAINDGMVLNVQKLAQLSSVKESFSGQVNMGFFDNQTLFYSAPVFVGEECPVVLVGVRSRENMQSMIASKAFYDKTLSCIIDSNGEVILSPTDLKAFCIWTIFLRIIPESRPLRRSGRCRKISVPKRTELSIFWMSITTTTCWHTTIWGSMTGYF